MAFKKILFFRRVRKVKKVLIFGPPGIGKSTICVEVAKKGLPSVDLENIDQENRKETFDSISYGIIGAADLHPKNQYQNTIKVLLVLEQQEYEERRKNRDFIDANKAKQPPHKIDHWLTYQYDYVIKADDDAVDKLIDIYFAK